MTQCLRIRCLSPDSHFLLWWHSTSLPENAARPAPQCQRAPARGTGELKASLSQQLPTIFLVVTNKISTILIHVEFRFLRFFSGLFLRLTFGEKCKSWWKTVLHLCSQLNGLKVSDTFCHLLCIWGFGEGVRTLISQKKSFPQSFETRSSPFLSTNMTTENVKFKLGLRWQNACLACRRPLAHPQDIWVHACNPTTWAVEAGRSEVQALSPGHLKVQKQPGI